jgi:hypothetical protein
MTIDTHTPNLVRVTYEWTIREWTWTPKYVVTVIAKPFDDPEGEEESIFEERSFLNPATAWDWVQSWGLVKVEDKFEARWTEKADSFVRVTPEPVKLDELNEWTPEEIAWAEGD